MIWCLVSVWWKRPKEAGSGTANKTAHCNKGPSLESTAEFKTHGWREVDQKRKQQQEGACPLVLCPPVPLVAESEEEQCRGKKGSRLPRSSGTKLSGEAGLDVEIQYLKNGHNLLFDHLDFIHTLLPGFKLLPATQMTTLPR